MAKIVRELMQSPVRAIGKGDTLAHARKILLREKVSRLVVVEGEIPIGILTKKDILKGLSNYRMRQRELDAIMVFEIMRSPVKAVNESASIAEAAKIMISENIRGIPVVDDRGALVGIITKTDFARHFSEDYVGKYSVNDVARGRSEIPVVHRNHTIMRVIDLMDELSSDRAIVIENEEPVGVITDTDLSFVRPYKSGGTFIKGKTMDHDEPSSTRIYTLPTADDVMSKSPIVAGGLEDAAAAATTLIENEIGGMPVVDENGKLEGMIAKFDFVRVIAKEGDKK